MLLDGSARVNDPRVRESILYNASRNSLLPLVQLLLHRGAEISKEGINSSALIEAIQSGNEAIVKLLLDNGAEIGTQTKRKRCPNALYVASAIGRLDMVQMLLDYEADVNLKGGENGYALIAAVSAGHMDVVQSRRQVEPT